MTDRTDLICAIIQAIGLGFALGVSFARWKYNV